MLAYVYQDELERYKDEFLEDVKSYWHKYQRLQIDRTLEHYGRGLPVVDEVRLLHIEPLGASPSLGKYTVPWPRPTEMTIVAEANLHGADAEQIATLWRGRGLTDGISTLCYDPHHVIVFRKSRTKVAELVVCFMCDNVAIPLHGSWEVINFAGDLPSKMPSRLQSTVESYVGGHKQKKSDHEPQAK